MRVFYQLRDLSEEFEIYLIATTDRVITETERNVVAPFCEKIFVFPLSKWKIPLQILLAGFRSVPFQVAYFYQLKIAKEIEHLLRKINPDFIFTQLLRTTEYVKNYHDCPKILDFMDAFSKGMERRYENSSSIYRFLFKEESKRLRNYERKIFDYFDAHTIISKQDKAFILHPQHEQIVVIPNGIDERFFQQQPSKKEADVIFVGNLGYPPNILATEYLNTRIFKKLPNLKFAIFGANPSNKLRRFETKNFKIKGYVKDIRQAYSSGKIFVAPMFIGTGLQNKLLEAMAQGIPCITTNLANNALGAMPEKEILIANTPEEFVVHIQRLLHDENCYRQIQENARNFVQNKYSWKEINRNLGKLILETEI